MDIDKALHTMIINLQAKTGKSLEEWMDVVSKKNLAKYGEIVRFLKDQYAMTHGFANLVAHKALVQDTSLSEVVEDQTEKLFKGKEHLKSLYEALMAKINALGDDIEVAPKKSYVSVRRKKQFATLCPATKTRFELGIQLKGQEAMGKLKVEKPSSMCSHKILLTDFQDIDIEVVDWIKKAYHNAK